MDDNEQRKRSQGGEDEERHGGPPWLPYDGDPAAIPRAQPFAVLLAQPVPCAQPVASAN